MRLAHYKIKTYPDLLCVGMADIEVVGHTLDHTGIYFDRTRLVGISDILLPTTRTGLKSSLMSGRFRDHVEIICSYCMPVLDTNK